MHRKIVGALHVVMGFLAVLPVMVLTALFGGIWGAAAYASHGHQATTVLGIGLLTILMIVAVTSAVAGTLGVIAGFGVLLGRRWGDVLATVISALHVFNVPVGTALAAYTFYGLWVADRAPLRAFPEREYGSADLQRSL